MATTAGAHHSDSDIDQRQLITLHGVVTRFKWQNPHIWIYLDAPGTNGRVTPWAIEGAPPGRIGGRGLKYALKTGDRVTITAYRAKDRSKNYARGYNLTLPDGRQFVIGPRAEVRE